jgi:inner membrane protein
MRLGLKLVLVGVLLLLLLIPLSMLRGLVYERQERGREVAEEVAGASAGPQTIVGPLLLVEARRDVPVTRVVERDGVMRNETTTEAETLHYLVTPDTLAIDNVLRTERRGRSLFQVLLYHDAMRLQGAIRHKLPVSDGATIVPRRAWLVLGLGDNRGLRTLDLAVDGRPVAAEPGARLPWLPEGLHVPVPVTALQQPIGFDWKIELTGTGDLDWLPVGGETTVTARGDWPHPGFGGRHLPQAPKIGATGFDAKWAVSRLSSRVQQALSGCAPMGDACSALDGGTFGVRLVEPVDRYLMTERAMKYALLFLALVFGAVFLVEALAARPVHFVQYGLTGLAMAMFYLLLLSFSEHLGFGPAYAVATAACVLLLAYYLAGVLGSRKRGIAFGIGLAGLYGLLYLLLRSEDFALLVGTGVLFAALAIVMVLTRRVDWSGLGIPRPGA